MRFSWTVSSPAGQAQQTGEQTALAWWLESLELNLLGFIGKQQQHFGRRQKRTEHEFLLRASNGFTFHVDADAKSAPPVHARLALTDKARTAHGQRT
ncbi:hypothetical protein PT2222_110103 [Paraburkholderia tropica]